MITYRYLAELGGWRYVVLFHHGRKWLKLLDTATLRVYRLPVAHIRDLRPYTIRPRTLANRLVARRARFRRLGIHCPEKAVQAAIDTLRNASR